jgi:hypothetical protein
MLKFLLSLLTDKTIHRECRPNFRQVENKAMTGHSSRSPYIVISIWLCMCIAGAGFGFVGSKKKTSLLVFNPLWVNQCRAARNFLEDKRLFLRSHVSVKICRMLRCKKGY